MAGWGDCDGGFMGDMCGWPGEGSGDDEGWCIGEVIPAGLTEAGPGEVTLKDCGLFWLPIEWWGLWFGFIGRGLICCI